MEQQQFRTSVGIGPSLRAFTVNVGKRGEPRLTFGCMARSSAEAVDQHLCLAEIGERVEALLVRQDVFPVNAQRHQLEEAQLRDLRIPFHADAIDVPDVDALRQVGAI